jgi:phosphoribosylanthranilate isomerase
VKICGITNLEDALTAVEAGADALGFVLYEKSPRKVDPDTVREVVEALPTEIEKVGVFVNESPERMESVNLHLARPCCPKQKSMWRCLRVIFFRWTD